MASLLSPRTPSTSLLRLPSHLRTSAYQCTLSRSFSASPPRKLSLIDIAVAPPTYLLDTLHSLGLPWSTALPISAVLIRGVVIYYFSILPGRKAAQIQSHLTPLAAVKALQRHESPERRELRRQRQKGMPITVRRLSDVIGKFIAQQQELHKLGKTFGAPRWRWRGLANFGVLIAMTEAIRMKCAAREGLLPLVISPFQWIGRTVRPDLFPTPPPMTQEAKDEALEARMEEATTVDAHGNVTYDFTRLSPAQADEAKYTAYFDPSLQQEGIAGWCMDLTVPDPTLMLPVMLGLGMAANIIFRPTAGARPQASQGPLSRGPAIPPKPATTKPTASSDLDTVDPSANASAQATLSAPPYTPPKFLGFLPPVTNAQRIGLVIAMAFGFAALKMPAAILLYFIPSLAVGWVQRRWLDVKYPLRAPIGQCARPLRMRVRREWGD